MQTMACSLLDSCVNSQCSREHWKPIGLPYTLKKYFKVVSSVLKSPNIVISLQGSPTMCDFVLSSIFSFVSVTFAARDKDTKEESSKLH